MTLIQPFRALRPAPGRAAEVLAPPYDVLSSAEARDARQGQAVELPAYLQARDRSRPGDRSLRPRRLRQGGREPRPHDRGRRPDPRRQALLLRLPADLARPPRRPGSPPSPRSPITTPTASASTSTRRPVKEDDRVRQIEAVNAQTGPVMIAYPAAPADRRHAGARRERARRRRRHRRRRRAPPDVGGRRRRDHRGADARGRCPAGALHRRRASSLGRRRRASRKPAAPRAARTAISSPCSFRITR